MCVAPRLRTFPSRRRTSLNLQSKNVRPFLGTKREHKGLCRARPPERKIKALYVWPNPYSKKKILSMYDSDAIRTCCHRTEQLGCWKFETKCMSHIRIVWWLRRPEASVKKQANCTQTETCVFPSKEQCSFLSRMAHSNMLILFCADKYPISENEVNSAQTEPCVLPIPKEQDGSWHYSKDMLILKGAQSGFVHYCVQGCKGTSFHERISCRFSNFWELELN